MGPAQNSPGRAANFWPAKKENKSSGTSHLRRHVNSCQAKSKSSSSLPIIGSFFKSSGVLLSVKKHITNTSHLSVRPFEGVNGDGFMELAQSLINVGVRYGQVSASDVLPHPSTVSRRVTDTVKPEIEGCIKKLGSAATTVMWTETYTQLSYITATVQYINEGRVESC